MVLTLLVLSAPSSGQAGLTALRFARAAVAGGHRIRQVFFYADGVAAAATVHTPADETDLNAGWRELAAGQGCPLLACETAVERRGVVASASAAVALGTLGQWAVALDESDRVVTFAD